MLALLAASAPASESARPPIPSPYSEPAPFLKVIEDERQPLPATPFPVTGITVPHHLLAADLIARGFWAAAGNRYDRVILLSPDHFNRSRKPFATTLRDFETVFGRIAADGDAIRTLLRDDLFGKSDLFEGEHGVIAVIPFLKRFFPEARLVPVAVSLRADPEEWRRAAELIRTLVSPGTLVVQSTDYSHYLPHAASLGRDQESLHVIAAGDADAVAGLISSDHMDSRGSQAIQMRLQAAFGARATVVASRNSVEYAPGATRTTSYIVSVYSPEVGAFPFRYPDQELMFFAGDAFLGRWLTRPLAEPRIAAELVRRVRGLTGDAPLVANLEGVVLAAPPEGIGDHLHAMHAGLALPILKALNVRAASLANNHSYDLGRDGYRESIARLRAAGIRPLLHGEVADLGPVRVVPLNFVGRNDRAGFPVVREGDLDRLCRAQANPPLLAFAHWGVEYAAGIGPEERAAAREMARCGVSAIIGAHSHRAAEAIESAQGGELAVVPSLGNFLFDQSASRGSGALLELRRFRQGTYALRLLPLPNLFDLANALLREGAPATPSASPR